MDKTVGTKKSAYPAWFQAQGSVWHKTMHDLCHGSWIGGVFWLGLWGVVLGPGKVQRWGIFRKDFLPGFGVSFWGLGRCKDGEYSGRTFYRALGESFSLWKKIPVCAGLGMGRTPFYMLLKNKLFL
jgi:hypothetical protein